MLLKTDLISDQVFGQIFVEVSSDLKQNRYSSAMMKLAILSKTHSKDLDYLKLLAQTQRCIIDFEGLIKTLEVKAKLTNESVDYIELMLVFYSQGRLNEALDVALLLQEGNLNSNENRIIAHCLVQIYLEFSDFEGVQEIIFSFKKADEDSVLLWALGLVYQEENQKQEALSCFCRAIELDRENEKAWISLARLHHEMGDQVLALANLEKVFDINPNNTTALKLLVKWHSKDLEQSKKVLSKIRNYLNKFEFDEEISLCYVQLLRENNELNLAQIEIEKLFLYNPTNLNYLSLKQSIQI